MGRNRSPAAAVRQEVVEHDPDRPVLLGHDDRTQVMGIVHRHRPGVPSGIRVGAKLPSSRSVWRATCLLHERVGRGLELDVLAQQGSLRGQGWSSSARGAGRARSRSSPHAGVVASPPGRSWCRAPRAGCTGPGCSWPRRSCPRPRDCTAPASVSWNFLMPPAVMYPEPGLVRLIAVTPPVSMRAVAVAPVPALRESR